ncbi:MAG: hydroxyethylthiazole kinase [Chloroflexota bacterium]|nr:hydroxyethylthiazole kinase [Chloroflexota bacterium]
MDTPVAERIAALRAAAPLVHCITNDVTSHRVADALVALGALPVMASAPEEVEVVARSADALLLNCGTPSAARWDAMRAAAAVASQRGIPVVVDPVGAGASSSRTERARGLVSASGAIVRGNAPEVAALAGVDAVGRIRGVTAVGVPADALPGLARSAAAALATTVLISGPVSVASDGSRSRSLPAVPPRYPAVGLGDVLGALVAAVACVETDRLEAAWSARELMDRAVEAAGTIARGPGSFWPALIDALGTHR